MGSTQSKPAGSKPWSRVLTHNNNGWNLFKRARNTGSLMERPGQGVAPRFVSLPLELGIEILSWIHPRDVMRFRRLSQNFNHCITSRHFAILNQQKYIPQSQTIQFDDSRIHARASEFDLLLPGWPQEYQQAYINSKYANAVNIQWRYSKFSCSKFPHLLGGIDSLELLDLSYCLLQGNVPEDFGIPASRNLKNLRLNSNMLTGRIPSSIGNFENLEKLNFMFNKLNGPLPASLGSLSQLNALYLNGNQLSGTIPVELGLLNNLEILCLNKNKLCGQLPVELANLEKLRKLDLSSNSLSGQIPDPIIRRLSSLLELELSNNEFSGCIPSSLSAPQNLRDVSMSCNNLSGRIPTELSESPNLEYFYADNNQLSGEIPCSLGNIASLRGLRLSNNKLTGVIPIEFCRLTLLREVFVRGNAVDIPGNVCVGSVEYGWFLERTDVLDE
ncbi:UNVERIFIED_CONTAM: hypothetical protein HDU68_000667 [Siphonaria sp. JEL0065]|nr:hypothetical protein HDU68_000667 [Siphonaria sp. JEL0065]